jgi:GNAT superfamily N-acetyltransferase
MGTIAKAMLFTAWRRAISLFGPSAQTNARRLRQRGEDMDRIVIRDATAADVPALAQLHVTTWNATYAPMGMTGPPVPVRAQQWRDEFDRDDARRFCFVAENESGELIGFAHGRPSDNPGYGGELSKIYVLRDYQRLGIGRRLVGHVARRFLAQGITSMWLFGDGRNPSRGAWLALGAHKTDDDPGNGNYGWHDLRQLVERCGIRGEGSRQG